MTKIIDAALTLGLNLKRAYYLVKKEQIPDY